MGAAMGYTANTITKAEIPPIAISSVTTMQATGAHLVPNSLNSWVATDSAAPLIFISSPYAAARPKIRK